jgi:hypothetical protein
MHSRSLSVSNRLVDAVAYRTVAFRTITIPVDLLLETKHETLSVSNLLFLAVSDDS